MVVCSLTDPVVTGLSRKCGSSFGEDVATDACGWGSCNVQAHACLHATHDLWIGFLGASGHAHPLIVQDIINW